MDQSVNTLISKYIEEYGEEAVVAAVATITAKRIPRINSPLVDDDKLQATLLQLDAAVADILEAGSANEEAYQNKAELMKRARQLETEIKLMEANAIMEIQGSGKDAFAIIRDNEGNQKRVSLTNDTQRDAFRRQQSATARQQLAEIEADIRKIDIDLMKAKDAYNAKQEAFNGIRIKATLQANVLAFLK